MNGITSSDLLSKCGIGLLVFKQPGTKRLTFLRNSLQHIRINSARRAGSLHNGTGQSYFAVKRGSATDYPVSTDHSRFYELPLTHPDDEGDHSLMRKIDAANRS